MSSAPLTPAAREIFRRRVALFLFGLLLAFPVAAEWAPRGMVAAEHRLAAQAGADILAAGGNAVDAAVATTFAVCVVNPSSCGIGGGGFMLIHLARGGRTVALDFREKAPAAATRDMFLRNGTADPALSRRGGRAVAVPGEVAGLALALRTHGTLRLAEALEPAVRLARDGFPIEAHLAKEISAEREGLAADPALARTFLHADGTPLLPGETLRQPELARTLARIAAEGPSAFYSGDIAAQIASAAQATGGVLTTADLAGYRPVWRTPVHGSYRGHEVVSMPPPSSGGGVILAALGMLGRDDLRALEWGSATYDHLLAETMKHVFADRAAYYGDPDFVDVPMRQLLAPATTAALRARIRAAGILDTAEYGSRRLLRDLPDDHGTSHLSVMDSEGNAVACTTTINTGFGALLGAGDTGILLNDQMDDFSAQPGVPNAYGLVGSDANAIAPGKKPLSSMSPTIVLRDGRPVLAVGGSGGPLIISGTLQVLLNVLDHGMDAVDAVSAPRLHHQWAPGTLLVEPGIPEATRGVLARRGHAVKEIAAMASIQAVRRNDGGFEGAADPRKGGGARGW